MKKIRNRQLWEVSHRFISRIGLILGGIWALQCAFSFSYVLLFFKSHSNLDNALSENIKFSTPAIDQLAQYLTCVSSNPDGEVATECERLYGDDGTSLSPFVSPLDRLIFVIVDGTRFDAVARLPNESQPHRSVLDSIHRLEDDPSIHTLTGAMIASNPTTTSSMLLSMMQGSYRSGAELLTFLTGFDEAENDNILKRLQKEKDAEFRLIGDHTWVENFGHDLFTTDSILPHTFDVTHWNICDETIQENVWKIRDYTSQSNKMTVEIFHSLAIDSMSHVTKDLKSFRMRAAFDMTNATIEKIVNCSGIKMGAVCDGKDVPHSSSTAILFVSDHGMTLSGGHGQDTHEEIQGMFHFAFPSSVPIVHTMPTLNSPTLDTDDIPFAEELLSLPKAHGSTQYHIMHLVDLPSVLAGLWESSSPFLSAGMPMIGYSNASLLYRILDNQWRLTIIHRLKSNDPPDSLDPSVVKAFRSITSQFYPAMISDPNDPSLEVLAEKLLKSDDVDQLLHHQYLYRHQRDVNESPVFPIVVSLAGLIGLVPLIVVLRKRTTPHNEPVGIRPLSQPTRGDESGPLLVHLAIVLATEALTIVDLNCYWSYRIAIYLSLLAYIAGCIMTGGHSVAMTTTSFILLPVLVRLSLLLDPLHQDEYNHPLPLPTWILPEWTTVLGIGMIVGTWEWCSNTGERKLLTGFPITVVTVVQQVAIMCIDDWYKHHLNRAMLFVVLLYAVRPIITHINHRTYLSTALSLYFMHGTPATNGPCIVPLITWTYLYWHLTNTTSTKQSASPMGEALRTGALITLSMTTLWYSAGNRLNFEAPFYVTNTFTRCTTIIGQVVGCLSVMYRLFLPTILGYVLLYRFGSGQNNSSGSTGSRFMWNVILVEFSVSAIAHIIALALQDHMAVNSLWAPRVVVITLRCTLCPIFYVASKLVANDILKTNTQHKPHH